MNVQKALPAGLLLAIAGAGLLWYASGVSRPGISEHVDRDTGSTLDSPEASQQTAAPASRSAGADDAVRASRGTVDDTVPSGSGTADDGAAGVGTSGSDAVPVNFGTGAGDAASVAAPSPDRALTAPDEQAVDKLKRDMTASAYREQGGLYVDYLVSNGLARSDAERLVRQGFEDAVACSFAAMRAEAEAEGVPFDTVLYAVEAMLYQGDGPLLRGVIDMEAVRAKELPCLLNVLQEVGIPAHVMQEIQRAAGNP